jgi:peroxiredoxin
VLSPQSADRAQKQATAHKLKFNLLVDILPFLIAAALRGTD